jgi:uncharacterized membrane protein
MEIDWLGLVFRWMHILAAITAVGGTVFMRLALLPAMAELPEESRTRLHEAIRSRWSTAIMWSIGFLLLSGVYNIIHVERTYEINRIPAYRMLFTAKLVLALGVFFLASALTGRGKATERIRQDRRLWLTVNLVLALTVVALSGVLRMTEKPRKPLKAVGEPRRAWCATFAGMTVFALPSFPLGREPSEVWRTPAAATPAHDWIPACAGMTNWAGPKMLPHMTSDMPWPSLPSGLS